MPAQRLLLPLATAAALLAVPAVAPAATRYASPVGFGAKCTEASPCTITQGVVGAGDGDEVVLAAGTYDLSNSPLLDIAHKITLSGATGGARPLITKSTDGAVVSVASAGGIGTTLRHLALQSTTPGTGIGFFANSPVSLDDVDVEGRDACAQFSATATIVDSSFRQVGIAPKNTCLTLLGDGTEVSRSTVGAGKNGIASSAADLQLSDITVHAGSGAALFASGGTAGHEVRVRRSTFAGGYAGIAINGDATVTDTVTVATAGDGVNAIAGNTRLHNVTAVGTTAGVRALAEPGLTAEGHIEAASVIARGGIFADEGGSHMLCQTPFNCADGALTIDHSVYDSAGPRVTLGAQNSTADPLFANPAQGDYHLLAGSSAIDQGISDALTGPLDRDGNARVQGTAVDAGAYETAPVAAPADGGQTPPPAGGDQTPPPLGGGSGPGLPADTIAPAISGLKISKRGARYKLSEAATVQITFRRVSHHRAGKAITLKRSGKRGTNALARKLHAGAYKVTIVATDSAGNRSKPKTTRLRVKR